MTMGSQMVHSEQAQLTDVQQFFFKYYRPANAILVVAGNVKTEQVRLLAEKWFGDIPSGEKYKRNLPVEPLQDEIRKLEVTADVPLDVLYKPFPMASRTEPGYYLADLFSEVP